MATSSSHHIIAGSERAPMRNARALGPVQADQAIEVTVRLRAAADGAGARAAAERADLGARSYLTREQFAQQHGASAADIASVAAFAHQHQLVVVRAEPAGRRMVLSGTAAAMAAAFGTALDEYEAPEGTYRGRVGPLSAPADVAPLIEGVFGLDDRPQANPKFQFAPGVAPLAAAVPPPVAAAQPAGSFTPPQLAKLYNFPPGLDGSGQCIGIIELGGGSRPADLNAYFKQLGLAAPKVKIISVDHAKNRPSTADSADGEVMLDIDVAGAIAPKALIAVYFAPNTDRGFLDAITTAVHDKVNKPSVISISWGAAEVHWTVQSMTAFEQVFSDAAAMGVTICCASGDNGSADGEADGAAHVDFPASAPHALGCGGTRVAAGAGGLLSETVWNDGPDSATGGGFSSHFDVPAYQQALGQGWSGRGVPDVAGNADPVSGYVVRVDGKQFVIGGTSAVAPLWAGLVALLNQKLARPVGFLQPLLYGSLQGKGGTRDITEGNNGAQQAGKGWDACTGWGSPNGQALLVALGGG
jgi:kumamolisin